MPDEPALREVSVRTIIQGGSLVGIIGMCGLLLKLVFIAGATLTTFTAGLEAEKAARIADIASIRQSTDAAEARLAAQIDTNSKLGTQQMTMLGEKISDMKASVDAKVSHMEAALDGILKASTPPAPIRR